MTTQRQLAHAKFTQRPFTKKPKETVGASNNVGGAQGQNGSGTPSPATALGPGQGADVSAVRREISQNQDLMHKELSNGAQGQNRTADTGIFSPLTTVHLS